MKTISGVFLIFLAATLALKPSASLAQSLPASDIWLIEWDGETPSTPRLVVGTGRYNNQPMFSRNGETFYFTMEREDNQTDIARVDIVTGAISIVHESPESEYSPTPIPGRQAISVIRVEAPDQRQRLWALNLDNSQDEVIFETIEPVGYHAWLSPDHTAVFLLGDTFDLHLATTGSEESSLLVKNIGRTLIQHPVTGELLYVDKNEVPWRITRLNIENNRKVSELPLFPGVEDFAVDAQGRYWMGSGSKLYRSSEDNSKWRLMGDYSEYGIKEISRLAVNQKDSKIILVVLRLATN